MSLAMTVQEREAFLADGHVGVLSVNQDARGSLSPPSGTSTVLAAPSTS
jgi:hypothetical protein